MSEETEDAPRPAAITFATTEHFNLATARASTISEANGRASLFLASLSASLIALSFIGQASELGTAFDAFGLVVLLGVVYLGVVSAERTLQASIDDVLLAKRTETVRRWYLEHAPELEGVLQPPPREDDAMSAVGVRASRLQLLLSVAGMIAMLTAGVAGGWAGFALSALGRVPVGVAVGGGVAVFVLAATLLLHHQAARWRAAIPELAAVLRRRRAR